MKLKQPSDNYFKLIPSKKNWLEFLSTPFIQLFNLLRNPLAIVLGRLFTYLIFDPAKARNQDQDKILHMNSEKNPDFEHMEDFYVINATARPSFLLSVLQNYARKFQSLIFKLPKGLKNKIQQILGFNVVKEKDCDGLVGRIMRTIKQVETDKGTFDFDNLFLKGLEFIDEDLRKETEDVINLALRKHLNKESFDIAHNREKVNFFTLETTDNAILDSVELSATGEAKKEMGERTFVIFCMPRGSGYCAWLKNLKIAAEKANTTYVAFNYRGVERSQGVIWTQDDMVNDAKSQAQRLLLMGVKAQNIAFEGECLGGAVATLAAEKMHKEGHKVKLFSARSFRSAYRFGLYKILPSKEASLFSPLTWARYFLSGIFLTVGAPMLYFSNWGLNVEKAWCSIPNEDKDFLVVRSAPNADGSKNLDDPDIEHQNASIYSLERDTLLNGDKTQFDKLHEHRFTVNPNNTSANLAHTPDPKKRNGHICQRHELIQRDGSNKVDAREYTANCYLRFWGKPARKFMNTVEPKPFPDCQKHDNALGG